MQYVTLPYVAQSQTSVRAEQALDFIGSPKSRVRTLRTVGAQNRWLFCCQRNPDRQ